MATGSTETALAVSTPKAILTQEALKAEGEQRALLAQFIQKQMVEGADYGKIPGTDKPTLLKPGAEKLTDLFRCTPKFHLVKIEEDFQKGFFNYVFRVRLYQRDADAVLAEGFGSANSMEGRYRWRDAQRKCPACSKAAIIKGKKEYGGGWLCFGKKGGCGAKFDDGAQEIEGQATGRVENDDIATLANTILKMAKKRALVDGAIALARCSDMFTQDVEDMEHNEPEPPPPSGKREAPRAPPSPKTAREPDKTQTPQQPRPGTGQVSVYERIAILCGEYGMKRDQMPAFVKATTGKTSSLKCTEDDIPKVHAQLETARVAKEAVTQHLGAPAPSDDDVPF